MATPVTATEEEVDECIDQSIQVNSNKQMRMEYLHPWTLKFKDSTQESKYCQLREDMFRSNMLCVFIVWIFIVLCQTVIIPQCPVLIVCLTVCSILLTAGYILVMAEEFESLPKFLQKSSAMLVHHRNHRTFFICAVILLMSVASSVGLFFCPMELFQIESNSTLSSDHTKFKLDLHISANVHWNASQHHHNATEIPTIVSNELNLIRAEIIDKVNKSIDKTASKDENEIRGSSYTFTS